MNTRRVSARTALGAIAETADGSSEAASTSPFAAFQHNWG